MTSLFDSQGEPLPAGFHAHARRTDPGTSHEAAAAVTPNLNALQMRVEQYARQRRYVGFTDAEMAHHLDDSGSTLRTRRAELVERNIILDSGRTRTFGDSPRKRIVWVHRDHAENPPAIREPIERKMDQRGRVAHAIATALWGQACADLYFNPRYDRAPDIRRQQALNAADAAIRAI